MAYPTLSTSLLDVVHAYAYQWAAIHREDPDDVLDAIPDGVLVNHGKPTEFFDTLDAHFSRRFPRKPKPGTACPYCGRTRSSTGTTCDGCGAA